MADGDNDDEIIVCQKDDGTYHYYYEKKNFVENLKTGTFSLVIWMRQKMNIHWKAPEK